MARPTKKIIAAVALLLVGAILAKRVFRFVAVDKCLDSGGRFNYSSGSCEHSRPKKYRSLPG
jgi:hypothetical protein